MRKTKKQIEKMLNDCKNILEITELLNEGSKEDKVKNQAMINTLMWVLK